MGIDEKTSIVKLNGMAEEGSLLLAGEVTSPTVVRGRSINVSSRFFRMIKAGHLFFVKCLPKQLFSKRFKEMWVW